MIPALAVAPKLNEEGPQASPFVTPEIVGIGTIVAVTGILEALVHPLLVAST